jgi:hypothetical protein
MVDSASGQLERNARKDGHRSNVMLAAVIQANGFSADVRIRNLSRMGALIEGTPTPEVGTALTLCRHQLGTDARVVWSRPGRCRLRFDQAILVGEWITQASRPGAGMSASQQRIDRIQADIRAGSAPPAKPRKLVAAEAGAQLEAVLPQRLAEEIAYVQRLIESVGDELIGEPLIVHRHAGALQKFDAVNQILGHLASILKAPDHVRAAEEVGMEELRSRLLRP